PPPGPSRPAPEVPASAPPSSAPASPPSGDPEPAPPAPSGGPLDLERLEATWVDAVLPTLGGLAKAMFNVGRFTGLDGTTAVLALPNDVHRQKCERKRPEVEQALSDAVGSTITLRLVVDDDPGAEPDRPAGGDSGGRGRPDPGPESHEDVLDGADVHDLDDAPDAPAGGLQALTEAFPGAELVEGER
ncbi:MAG: hypothetical protein KF906_05910, partial [Actinobacteria bacterium]|nr:hypothetical protein [Actinomycetota bacterium]